MFLVFSPAVEKLEIVECDLEKPEQIKSALGNASTVICTIGASEKEIFDITGPYRIDYMATKNLVDAGNKSFRYGYVLMLFVLGLNVENKCFCSLCHDAASVAKVNHFILVTSLGTNKFGFPAAILK
jgi:hypothetical protein